MLSEDHDVPATTEDLSQDDMAAILTDVLGRSVHNAVGDRDQDKDKATFMQYGMSEAIAQALIDMHAAKAWTRPVGPADLGQHHPDDLPGVVHRGAEAARRPGREQPTQVQR